MDSEHICVKKKVLGSDISIKTASKFKCVPDIKKINDPDLLSSFKIRQWLSNAFNLCKIKDLFV